MRPRQVRRVRRPTIDSQPQETNRPPVLTAKTHHRQSGRPHRIVLGTIVILGLVLLWFGGRITSINIANSNNPARIEQLVDDQLGQKFWYHNIFLLPASRVEEAITSSHPDTIASIQISKSWLSRAINVNVEERRAVIKWQISSGVYGVDQKGVISSLSGGEQDKMPLIIDNTNLDVKLGRAVVPPRFVDFVLDLQKELPGETKLTFRRGRLIETSNELLVDTNQNYYLRMDTTRTAAEQIAVLRKLLSKSIKPSQYIDLRIPYKVYYR